MGLRRLRRDQALTSLRDEIVYPAITCKRDPRAADQAPLFQALLVDWDAVFKQQLGHWDAQTEASVLVHAADDVLDEHVDDFAGVVRTKQPGRMSYYFEKSPSALRRPVLGAELETVRNWIPALHHETSPDLSKYAPVFQGDVKVADAAVQAETDADEANRRFREIGELAAFLDKVEATRDKVYATLDQRRVDHPEWGVDRNWAAGVAERAAARKAREEQRLKILAAREKLDLAKKELDQAKKGG
jgi:hypothetical protein